MINNISWGSYAYALSVVLLLYYAFVLVAYYGDDIRGQYLKFKKITASGKSLQNQSAPEGDVINHSASENPGDQPISIAELLLILHGLIQTAADRAFPREELLLALQLELKKYNAFKDSSYCDTINTFIISECKNNCSMHLTGYEVGRLWGV